MQQFHQVLGEMLDIMVDHVKHTDPRQQDEYTLAGLEHRDGANGGGKPESHPRLRSCCSEDRVPDS
jgi:hypothetical protein